MGDAEIALPLGVARLAAKGNREVVAIGLRSLVRLLWATAPTPNHRRGELVARCCCQGSLACARGI